ncbi:protein of unknown function [Taphrina deformans PYCC 5710]|uniref:Uncharacterized protein n=1 Tax=Taphrina deformans (strain PYCC 5710 / ATCC 11124 / CBS 356.35 / IMI 108563 / JCM 9778 / NBRC 8474) TaxID=1097556 RepID=R4XHK6_TAPDE|nr:protein of unknown function [Taphrina deformans PYCC 5710]|eukprot:CCG84008.1 protein of unknown function [Taphrina deformans PYCC 5710]
MSLADRRVNAPHHLGPIPTFELHTPTRTLDGILPFRRLDSVRSIDSFASQTTLPMYEAEEDDNPDVITTSMEIDPEDDDDDDSDVEATPRPNTVVRTTEHKKTKRSGMSKLFSRTDKSLPKYGPGVRLTRLPRLLKSREKDIRAGFSLGLPYHDGVPVIDVDPSLYMQAMSRINILLSAGATRDVQELIASQVELQEHVSFVKLADVKGQKHSVVKPAADGEAGQISGLSDSINYLTIPELDPSARLSDDESSFDQRSMGRRGSAASTSSFSSTKSSLSQRIKFRFEKREEWCLLFE